MDKKITVTKARNTAGGLYIHTAGEQEYRTLQTDLLNEKMELHSSSFENNEISVVLRGLPTDTPRGHQRRSPKPRTSH